MPILLHLDASPSLHTSISRSLTSAFVDAWQTRHGAEGKVLRRDLGVGDIPRVGEPWIAAAFIPATMRTVEQREVLAFSDELVQELKQADEYVLGVPMYNFGVPAVLKLWIDQVVRLGETYGFDGKERHGLLKHKKAHVFRTSGGTYDPGAPSSSVNFVDPYLQAVLGYMGITEVESYAADGTAAIVRGLITRDEFLAPHFKNITQ